MSVRTSPRRKRKALDVQDAGRSRIEHAFKRIASVLDSGKPAVIITGAGLSVASGIPT